MRNMIAQRCCVQGPEVTQGVLLGTRPRCAICDVHLRPSPPRRYAKQEKGEMHTRSIRCRGQPQYIWARVWSWFELLRPTFQTCCSALHEALPEVKRQASCANSRASTTKCGVGSPSKSRHLLEGGGVSLTLASSVKVAPCLPGAHPIEVLSLA